jgi:hypothetical protein
MQLPKPKVSPATNYSIVFIEREKPKAKINIRFCNSILLVGSLRAKAFNPDQTTFMDCPKGNTRFMYVLPTSTSEVLLEYTLFRMIC